MSAARARLSVSSARARIRKVRESLYDRPYDEAVALLLQACDDLAAAARIVGELVPRHRRGHGKRR